MSGEQRDAALTGSEAKDWIEAAARYGLVEAQLLLGQACLDAGDDGQALAWFRVAATTSHAGAINMVGRCYELGWGTPPDPAEAATYYRRAAEQGLDWAQFNLANLLLYGLGLEQDRRGAYELYARAAAQGHAKSLNMLGRFHEEGWDRPRDMARAASCYATAAEAGDFRAQFNVGMLLAGAGRYEEASRWIERAFASASPDFLLQAGDLLRASGDPYLQAVAGRLSPPGPRPPPAPARPRC